MTGVSENSPHCDTHLSNCSSVSVALSLAVSSHLCFFVILFLFLVVKRYFQISPHPIIYRFSVSVLFKISLYHTLHLFVSASFSLSLSLFLYG